MILGLPGADFAPGWPVSQRSAGPGVLARHTQENEICHE